MHYYIHLPYVKIVSKHCANLFIFPLNFRTIAYDTLVCG